MSLDPQLLEQYGDRTSLIFCLNLAEPGLTDANDFINQYYQAVALAKISRGEAFDEVCSSMGGYLQFDARRSILHCVQMNRRGLLCGWKELC